MPHIPRPAIVHRAKKFKSSHAKLPYDIQETVDAMIKLMEKDWTDDFLDKKKMGGYPAKWRFKVNAQYRMTADKLDGDEFILEFVGTKNEFKKRYGGS